jgi:hypothetical protein
MSYDPSRRTLPPRQGGWPQATPPRAWPGYRDDSAYQDADQATVQDEATGEGSYWAGASSQPQPAYPGQAAYQGQPGYQAQPAYEPAPGYQAQPAYEPAPGYQAQPAYAADPAYQGTAGYQGRPAYERQPAYQGRPAYERQPAYQGRPAYEGQPAYQGRPAYEGQPAYQGQLADGAPPDYRAEPGYQDAFDGSADHGYLDYRPTRVIDTLPASPDGYAYGRGGHDGRSGVRGYYGEPADEFDGGDYGYGVATDGFDGAGYGAPDAYADYGNGNGWSGRGYQDASRGGYGTGADGYGTGADAAAAGYGPGADAAAAGYGPGADAAADGYGTGADAAVDAEPRPSGTMLMAPDAGMLPHHWQADRDRRQEQRRRGVLVGAVTGFLAAAVAIGVTTLAAAVIRPPASPVVAVGNVFIDRTPGALKNLVMAHFGAHGRTALLLAMYVIIALVAMALGAATRRAPALGGASIAAGVLVAAFITITRPQGGPGAAVPWVIGGIAGVAALLWLVRSSAPTRPDVPVRTARGRSRRRTR